MEDEEAIKAIRDLRDYLRRFVDDINDLRALAHDADLEVGRIRFEGTAWQVCHEVVEHARKYGKLRPLADAVLPFAHNDTELIAIKERLPPQRTGQVPLTGPTTEKTVTAPLGTSTGVVTSVLDSNLSSQENTEPFEVITPDVMTGPTAHGSILHKSVFSIILPAFALPVRKITLKLVSITIIFIMIIAYTVWHFMLLTTPLLTMAQLAIFLSIIIPIEIIGTIVIFLMLVFLILVFPRLKESDAPGRWFILLQRVRNQWKWPDRRWALVISGIFLVVIFGNLCLSFVFQQKVQNVVSSSYVSPYIGLCDGRCNTDIDRSDRSAKGLAATELKSQHRDAACAYLDLAGNAVPTDNQAGSEDPTDAEAKIYYEDQCGGNNNSDGKNLAPLACPCINYVAVIALVKEQQQRDAPYTDPAIYSNGVSRSILQAVYLQQKTWNEKHKNGPSMYIFVANVGDVNDLQHASQWQQSVAQQIISLQQIDREHHINGIVGLPQPQLMGTFMDQLDRVAIPMISLASLNGNDTVLHPYLLSVAPTIEMEMSAAAKFLTKDIMKNKQNFSIGVIYYHENTAVYSRMVGLLEEELQRSNVPKLSDQPYDGLPQDTVSPVTHLAMSAARKYGAIVFIGPVNDLLTFMITLRQTDQTTPVLATNQAYQSVYNYQPVNVASAMQGLYFTAFAYHETKDYTDDPSTSLMIDEFKSAYDPKSIHSGNIYTYQLPSSDAIVAFDTMGVFTYLIDHYGIHVPDWQTQQEFLALSPHTMASGNIQFAATGNTPRMKTVLLLQMRPNIYYMGKYM